MNKVYLFESLPENKKYYPEFYEKPMKKDDYNTNLMTSGNQIITENSQENKSNSNYQQKNDLVVNNTYKHDSESITPSDNKTENIRLNSSKVSLIQKMTNVAGTIQNTLESIEMKTLETQLHEMESHLHKLKFDHELKSNFSLKNDKSLKSDLNSNFLNSKNNFTIENSKANLNLGPVQTWNNVLISTNPVISSSR